MAALKGLVIGMGVLIVAGTVTLAVLLVQRLGGETSAVGPYSVSLGPAEGARIAGIAASERAIAVWVNGPEGERVMLFDPVSGRRLGELRLGQ